MRIISMLVGSGLVAVAVMASLLGLVAPPVVGADDDHGDYRSLATQIGIGFGAVSGQIDETSPFFDVDYFAFETKRGVKYTFTLDLTQVTDANLTVIDSSERGAGVSDEQTLTWNGNQKQVEWVAPTSGTYYLEVFGAQGAPDGPIFLGSYTLSAAGEMALEDRHDQYPSGATPIAIGNEYQGAVSPWPNQPIYTASVRDDYDRDYFSFRTSRGVKYNITAILGTVEGVEIAVADQAGNIESANDGLGNELEWIAPSTSIYYAIISGSSLVRQPVGTYTLEVSADLLLEDQHSDARQGATPISLGTQHMGAISPTEDNDYFSFQALRGVRYSFQVTPGTVEGVGISVFDPADSIETNTGGVGYALDWVAPSTAIYSVVVSGSQLLREPVGTYTLEVFAEMGLEDRHGESRDKATQISFGYPYEGSVSPADDVDHFSFQAIRGVEYTFQANTGTSNGVSISVLDPADGVIGTTAGVEEQLVWTAPATDTYYATITGSNRVNDAIGTYSLEVNADLSLEDHHSDGREGATPIRLGSVQQGAISPEEDQDYFFFHAVRGVKYDIEVSPGGMAAIGIAVALPVKGVELSNSGLDNSISWIAPSDDTYFVEISASPQVVDATGTYSLEVNANTTLEDRHSDSREGATHLGFRTVYNGAISPETDFDFFSFAAKRGMKYTVDVGSGVGVDISIGKPGEGLVISNEGMSSELEWIASDNGTYFVILSGSGRVNDAVTVYSLNVEPDSTLEDRHNDSAESATIISFGDSVSGAISPKDDKDRFSFFARRGVLYTFNLTYGTAPLVSLSVDSVDTSQPSVAANFGEESDITWVSPITGAYIVTVSASPRVDEPVGTYFLEVNADTRLEDRHSDELSGATEIPRGNSISGAISPVDDKDNFTFSAEKGRTYLVEVETEIDEFFRFTVTNPESGFTESNFGTGTLLSITAPTEGDFYVIVSANKSGDATIGKYQINVTPDTFAPTINPPRDGQPFSLLPSAVDMVLEAGVRTALPGGSVRLPIMVEKSDDVLGVTFSLDYDPEVLKVVSVTKGSLFSPSTFRFHSDYPGFGRFGFASDEPVNGDGTAAVVEFKVVGEAGSSSEIILSRSLVSDSYSRALAVSLEDGMVTIGQRIVGDGDGDGVVTALDGLIALRMAAKTMKVDLALDLDGDGALTMEDARQILVLAGSEKGI